MSRDDSNNPFGDHRDDLLAFESQNPYAAPEPRPKPRYSVDSDDLFRPSLGDEPDINFDHLINGFELAYRQLGVWILVQVLIFVIGFVVNLLVQIILIATSEVAGQDSPLIFLLALPGFVVGIGLNAFSTGGSFRVACKQARGESIKVSDLFDIGPVYWQLCLGFFLEAFLVILLAIASLLIWGFAAALFGDGAGIAAGIVVGLITFVIFLVGVGRLMLVFPLIVEGRQTALRALRLSWRSTGELTLPAIIFHAGAVILSIIGVVLCCFGILFTFPVYYTSIALVYQDLFGKAK